ncbi:FtsW/RodA/SpoVE family cell cycle protein [Haoranjiania flava]|uniref:Probable peptidoglycan glycosyltransferase FtsW n=1 Tax=Haoranjiania flava TaxID=1856322 RepID=A0AAE3LMX9_9BACT|nr:FtsW/RodA/SpoVE family cell cycle protein [Haoranjiania flava]MCU7694376.1 FtsW/RodA/SpoVE family cell cycle protein [Haoranjiania flava]
MSSTYNIDGSVKKYLGRIKGDQYIWGCAALLALVSMLVVYSATGSLAYKMNNGNTEIYLFKQLVFILLGFGMIYLLHKVNYALFSKIALILYIISIPLLAYTLFFGAEINSGVRWIEIPIINMTFQTSDFAKLALYMFLSRQLSRKQENDKIKDLKKGFLPVFIPIVLTCGLIMPANLSNALLTGLTSLLLLFIGRVRYKHIFMMIGVAMIPVLLIVGVAVTTYNPDLEHTHNKNIVKMETVQDESSVFKRFSTWVSRVQDFLFAKGDDVPYQVQQSRIAIANGGVLFGLGPGNSEQRNYLPQAYNDFIYSIIIEEYGLLGGVFIIFIYLVFLYRCISIFRKCPGAFGAFLALGLSFTLVIQAVSNMAVNVGLIPVTGVTLPLISMGGTSFLFTCASIGIILSVSRYVELNVRGNVENEGDAVAEARPLIESETIE